MKRLLIILLVTGGFVAFWWVRWRGTFNHFRPQVQAVPSLLRRLRWVTRFLAGFEVGITLGCGLAGYGLVWKNPWMVIGGLSTIWFGWLVAVLLYAWCQDLVTRQKISLVNVEMPGTASSDAPLVTSSN